MDDIKWSKAIEHTGGEQMPPEIAGVLCQICEINNDEKEWLWFYGAKADDWGWHANITHYKIPQADYDRIYGEKKVYALAPEGCKSWLTAGKVYPAQIESAYAFSAVADYGKSVSALWEGCAHLNGGDWQRLELTEAEAAAINANVDAEKGEPKVDLVVSNPTVTIDDTLEAIKYACEHGAELEGAERSTSDGSSASYYELPEGASELQDLISHRNMNAQDGEIFRAIYRKGRASHSDELRDAKKVLFYAQAEVKRLEALNK